MRFRVKDLLITHVPTMAAGAAPLYEGVCTECTQDTLCGGTIACTACTDCSVCTFCSCKITAVSTTCNVAERGVRGFGLEGSYLSALRMEVRAAVAEASSSQ